jgi:hypothetical protein
VSLVAERAKHFIKKATAEHKGLFKKKAEAAGESTAAYATKEAGAPGKLGKEARLATTLMSMHGQHAAKRYAKKTVGRG